MIPPRRFCLSNARWSVVASVLVLSACGSSGGAGGMGGSTNTGGNSATGGTTGSGGTSGSSGRSGAGGGGGAVSTGGATATGGSIGSGGRGGTGAGGTGGAGGPSSGGAGGTGGRGGATGTGGATGGAGGGGSTCPGTVKAGDSTQTITSGGKSRTFIVHVPTGYTGSSPLPVIFDFHPLGGTGQGQEQTSGWNKKCDSVGCIAVFPNSFTSDNSWNVGYCCEAAQQTPIDDVQFTKDMIKWLEANACVDPKRIYASGCSNGGGMSYMLACKAADVIAAVAPVDFRCVTGADPASASSLTATNNTACTCTLARPISVTAFDEGQDNSVVPYGGGETVVHNADCSPGGSCKPNFIFPSAQVNFGTWANFDMCTGSPTTDPDNSICQTYASCAGNTKVTQCTAASSSHCGSYGLAKIVDTAWTMFQKETLP